MKHLGECSTPENAALTWSNMTQLDILFGVGTLKVSQACHHFFAFLSGTWCDVISVILCLKVCYSNLRQKLFLRMQYCRGAVAWPLHLGVSLHPAPLPLGMSSWRPLGVWYFRPIFFLDLLYCLMIKIRILKAELLLLLRGIFFLNF